MYTNKICAGRNLAAGQFLQYRNDDDSNNTSHLKTSHLLQKIPPENIYNNNLYIFTFYTLTFYYKFQMLKSIVPIPVAVRSKV
jgi:hypothetical protein